MLATVVFASLAALSMGAVCTGPKATPSSFSTTDAFFHSSTTFIMEIVLECENGAKDVPLYAEVGGRLMPVAVSEETGRYQVSWSEEHAKAAAGPYNVAFYDEDGYSALRKAQREGGSAGSVSPLFTLTHSHPGASRGAFVTSETLMTAAAAVVFYAAYSWRSQLQA